MESEVIRESEEGASGKDELFPGSKDTTNAYAEPVAEVNEWTSKLILSVRGNDMSEM